MDPIRFAIQNPVKVAVGVILVVLFGIIALETIPIQLTPNVDQPVITIKTSWVGRSPEQVEKDIVEEQEDKLKGISGLKTMTATASEGEANIELEFNIGTDMTRALQEVSDSLREVPSYPEDVDEPVITAADSAQENAIAWIILDSTDPEYDIQGFFDTADKRIKPILERVDGVGEINVLGGREREVHIEFDPERLAQRGLTIPEMAQSLRSQNVDVSAGGLNSGRRDVRITTVGQYDELDQIRTTVVAYDDAGGPIRVSDVAKVDLTLAERRTFVRSRGEGALAIQVIRESGSNVISTMAGLRERIDVINNDMLPGMGPGLKLRQVYDESVYIEESISLVQNNLVIGGALAIVALLLFLAAPSQPVRVLTIAVVALACAILWMALPAGWWSWVVLAVLAVVLAAAFIVSRPTAIIALAIPISVVGTFVVMAALGRNLNVVSLAGLAFAVGMVVDAAIVVLENIDRHLAMGKGPRKAAFDASTEVWGAILASTLTTLAVFLPVIFIQEEAGQLFRDIAIAICAAVSLSLIVSVTVIPSAAAGFLRPRKRADGMTPAASAGAAGVNPSASSPPLDDDHRFEVHSAESARGPMKMFRHGVEGFANLIYWLTARDPARLALRIGIVAAFTLISLVGSWLLMPPTSYLPSGNRNLVFGIMLNPSGYSVAQNERLARDMERVLRPYWEAESEADLATLPPLERPMMIGGGTVEGVSPIENNFIVSFGNRMFGGATSSDPSNVKPLGDLMTAAFFEPAGTIGFAQQASIFGRGLGGTNAIAVDISSDDLAQLSGTADALLGRFRNEFGFPSVRPEPQNFNDPSPEQEIRVDRVRASAVGATTEAVGMAVRAMVDGLNLGDFRLGGESIDLLLIRDPADAVSLETLLQTPLVVPDRTTGMSQIIPLAAITTVDAADSPQEIRRKEQLRSITLTVTPEGMALETAIDRINEIIEESRHVGAIPPGVEVRLSGTADKLTQVRGALLGTYSGFNMDSLLSIGFSSLFIALLVTYLLMAALFESFLYPAVILFSVPLATVGGFGGLAIMHYARPEQQLDVLTMLGFIILIGIVVNNAILIVHQSLNFMRGEGETDASDIPYEPMLPREAIRESVRTRIRPIMMTTLTSVAGMLPLVLMPGSGSELYGGLGSVVVGGLVVSTLFTLIIVPLLFSLVLDGKRALYGWLEWELEEANGAVAQPQAA